MLNPEKTKVVYCKSWKHQGKYERIGFDFLGFTFRPRLTKMRTGQLLFCFLYAISQKASKRIRNSINAWSWSIWTQMEIKDIIRFGHSKLRGWMAFYEKFGQNLIKHVLFHFDQKFSRWAEIQNTQKQSTSS